MFTTRDEIKAHISDTLGINTNFIEVGKLYQGRISVFNSLEGKVIMVGYDNVDYNDKSKGFKIIKILRIPEKLVVMAFPSKRLSNGKLVTEVPVNEFEEYSDEANRMFDPPSTSTSSKTEDSFIDIVMKERSKSTTVTDFEDYEDKLHTNKCSEYAINSITNKAYACIHLRIPMSGLKWLDKLIIESNKLHKNG